MPMIFVKNNGSLNNDEKGRFIISAYSTGSTEKKLIFTK